MTLKMEDQMKIKDSREELQTMEVVSKEEEAEVEEQEVDSINE